MNKDQVEGQWKIISGRIQRFWAEGLDDQTGLIRANATEIVGRLQKEFGLAKEEAESAWERWQAEFQPRAAIEAQWTRFEQAMSERWDVARTEFEKAGEEWRERIAAVEADADILAERLKTRFNLSEDAAKRQIAAWLSDVRQWLESKSRA